MRTELKQAKDILGRLEVLLKLNDLEAAAKMAADLKADIQQLRDLKAQLESSKSKEMKNLLLDKKDDSKKPLSEKMKDSPEKDQIKQIENAIAEIEFLEKAPAMLADINSAHLELPSKSEAEVSKLIQDMSRFHAHAYTAGKVAVLFAAQRNALVQKINDSSKDAQMSAEEAYKKIKLLNELSTTHKNLPDIRDAAATRINVLKGALHQKAMSIDSEALKKSDDPKAVMEKVSLMNDILKVFDANSPQYEDIEKKVNDIKPILKTLIEQKIEQTTGLEQLKNLSEDLAKAGVLLAEDTQNKDSLKSKVQEKAIEHFEKVLASKGVASADLKSGKATFISLSSNDKREIIKNYGLLKQVAGETKAGEFFSSQFFSHLEKELSSSVPSLKEKLDSLMDYKYMKEFSGETARFAKLDALIVDQIRLDLAGLAKADIMQVVKNYSVVNAAIIECAPKEAQEGKDDSYSLSVLLAKQTAKLEIPPDKIMAELDVINNNNLLKPADKLGEMANLLGNCYELNPKSMTPEVLEKYNQLSESLLQNIANDLQSNSQYLLSQLDTIELSRDNASKGFGDAQMSPTFSQFAKNINEISFSVIQKILEPRNIHAAILIAKQWIEIAAKAFNEGDFNTGFAILSGLESSAVNRIIPAIENNTASAYHAELLQKMRFFSNTSSSYANQRNALEVAMQDATMKGAVPYTGTFATDITFIEDGNQDYKDDNGNKVSKKAIRDGFKKTIVDKFQALKDGLKDIDVESKPASEIFSNVKSSEIQIIQGEDVLSKKIYSRQDKDRPTLTIQMSDDTASKKKETGNLTKLVASTNSFMAKKRAAEEKEKAKQTQQEPKTLRNLVDKTWSDYWNNYDQILKTLGEESPNKNKAEIAVEAHWKVCEKLKIDIPIDMRAKDHAQAKRDVLKQAYETALMSDKPNDERSVFQAVASNTGAMPSITDVVLPEVEKRLAKPLNQCSEQEVYNAYRQVLIRAGIGKISTDAISATILGSKDKDGNEVKGTHQIALEACSKVEDDKKTEVYNKVFAEVTAAKSALKKLPGDLLENPTNKFKGVADYKFDTTTLSPNEKEMFEKSFSNIRPVFENYNKAKEAYANMEEKYNHLPALYGQFLSDLNTNDNYKYIVMLQVLKNKLPPSPNANEDLIVLFQPITSSVAAIDDLIKNYAKVGNTAKVEEYQKLRAQSEALTNKANEFKGRLENIEKIQQPLAEAKISDAGLTKQINEKSKGVGELLMRAEFDSNISQEANAGLLSLIGLYDQKIQADKHPTKGVGKKTELLKNFSALLQLAESRGIKVMLSLDLTQKVQELVSKNVDKPDFKAAASQLMSLMTNAEITQEVKNRSRRDGTAGKKTEKEAVAEKTTEKTSVETQGAQVSKTDETKSPEPEKAEEKKSKLRGFSLGGVVKKTRQAVTSISQPLRKRALEVQHKIDAIEDRVSDLGSLNEEQTKQFANDSKEVLNELETAKVITPQEKAVVGTVIGEAIKENNPGNNEIGDFVDDLFEAAIAPDAITETIDDILKNTTPDEEAFITPTQAAEATYKAMGVEPPQNRDTFEFDDDNEDETPGQIQSNKFDAVVNKEMTNMFSDGPGSVYGDWLAKIRKEGQGKEPFNNFKDLFENRNGSCKELWADFYQEAKSKFAHENLDFFIACDEFKNNPSAQKFAQIYEKFIQSGLFNIGADAREILKQQYHDLPDSDKNNSKNDSVFGEDGFGFLSQPKMDNQKKDSLKMTEKEMEFQLQSSKDEPRDFKLLGNAFNKPGKFFAPREFLAGKLMFRLSLRYNEFRGEKKSPLMSEIIPPNPTVANQGKLPGVLISANKRGELAEKNYDFKAAVEKFGKHVQVTVQDFDNRVNRAVAANAVLDIHDVIKNGGGFYVGRIPSNVEKLFDRVSGKNKKNNGAYLHCKAGRARSGVLAASLFAKVALDYINNPDVVKKQYATEYFRYDEFLRHLETKQIKAPIDHQKALELGVEFLTSKRPQIDVSPSKMQIGFAILELMEGKSLAELSTPQGRKTFNDTHIDAVYQKQLDISQLTAYKALDQISIQTGSSKKRELIEKFLADIRNANSSERKEVDAKDVQKQVSDDGKAKYYYQGIEVLEKNGRYYIEGADSIFRNFLSSELLKTAGNGAEIKALAGELQSELGIYFDPSRAPKASVVQEAKAALEKSAQSTTLEGTLNALNELGVVGQKANGALDYESFFAKRQMAQNYISGKAYQSISIIESDAKKPAELPKEHLQAIEADGFVIQKNSKGAFFVYYSDFSGHIQSKVITNVEDRNKIEQIYNNIQQGKAINADEKQIKALFEIISPETEKSPHVKNAEAALGNEIPPIKVYSFVDQQEYDARGITAQEYDTNLFLVSVKGGQTVVDANGVSHQSVNPLGLDACPEQNIKVAMVHFDSTGGYFGREVKPQDKDAAVVLAYAYEFENLTTEDVKAGNCPFLAFNTLYGQEPVAYISSKMDPTADDPEKAPKIEAFDGAKKADSIPIYLREDAYKEYVKDKLLRQLDALVFAYQQEGKTGGIQANLTLPGMGFFSQLGGEYSIAKKLGPVAAQAYKEALEEFALRQDTSKLHIAAVRLSYPDKANDGYDQKGAIEGAFVGIDSSDFNVGGIKVSGTTKLVEDMDDNNYQQAVFINGDPRAIGNEQKNQSQEPGVLSNIRFGRMILNALINVFSVANPTNMFNQADKANPTNAVALNEEQTRQHRKNIQSAQALSLNFKKFINENQQKFESIIKSFDGSAEVKAVEQEYESFREFAFAQIGAHGPEAVAALQVLVNQVPNPLRSQFSKELKKLESVKEFENDFRKLKEAQSERTLENIRSRFQNQSPEIAGALNQYFEQQKAAVILPIRQHLFAQSDFGNALKGLPVEHALDAKGNLQVQVKFSDRKSFDQWLEDNRKLEISSKMKYETVNDSNGGKYIIVQLAESDVQKSIRQGENMQNYKDARRAEQATEQAEQSPKAVPKAPHYTAHLEILEMFDPAIKTPLLSGGLGVGIPFGVTTTTVRTADIVQGLNDLHGPLNKVLDGGSVFMNPKDYDLNTMKREIDAARDQLNDVLKDMAQKLDSRVGMLTLSDREKNDLNKMIAFTASLIYFGKRLAEFSGETFKLDGNVNISKKALQEIFNEQQNDPLYAQNIAFLENTLNGLNISLQEAPELQQTMPNAPVDDFGSEDETEFSEEEKFEDRNEDFETISGEEVEEETKAAQERKLEEVEEIKDIDEDTYIPEAETKDEDEDEDEEKIESGLNKEDIIKDINNSASSDEKMNKINAYFDVLKNNKVLTQDQRDIVSELKSQYVNAVESAVTANPASAPKLLEVAKKSELVNFWNSTNPRLGKDTGTLIKIQAIEIVYKVQIKVAEKMANAPVDLMKTKVSFDELFNHRDEPKYAKAWKDFNNHCEKNDAQENIDFLVQCQAFEKSPSTKLFVDIYEKFIQNNKLNMEGHPESGSLQKIDLPLLKQIYSDINRTGLVDTRYFSAFNNIAQMIKDNVEAELYVGFQAALQDQNAKSSSPGLMDSVKAFLSKISQKPEQVKEKTKESDKPVQDTQLEIKNRTDRISQLEDRLEGLVNTFDTLPEYKNAGDIERYTSQVKIFQEQIERFQASLQKAKLEMPGEVKITDLEKNLADLKGKMNSQLQKDTEQAHLTVEKEKHGEFSLSVGTSPELSTKVSPFEEHTWLYDSENAKNPLVDPKPTDDISKKPHIVQDGDKFVYYPTSEEVDLAAIKLVVDMAIKKINPETVDDLKITSDDPEMKTKAEAYAKAAVKAHNAKLSHEPPKEKSQSPLQDKMIEMKNMSEGSESESESENKNSDHGIGRKN